MFDEILRERKRANTEIVEKNYDSKQSIRRIQRRDHFESLLTHGTQGRRQCSFSYFYIYIIPKMSSKSGVSGETHG